MPEGLHSARLDNGLEVHVFERHAHPLATSMIWYRVGSRDEGLGETGISHFLEHMMFKGSARYPKGEVDRQTARGGGANNAFTSYDYTAYYFDFAADRWDHALEIEADRMRGCLLDPAEFEAEKQVVLEELAMGKDDPWQEAHEELSSHAFVVHPYHHPIIGYADDLRALSVERMRAWYERAYRPDNAIAVVAGDVDPAQVIDRLSATLGAVRVEGEPHPRASVPSEPTPRGERRVRLLRDTSVSRLACAWRAAEFRSADRMALDALEVMLGWGRSSRLYEGLVQKEGLASTVETEADLRRDDGLFWAWAELREDADPEHVEEALLEHIEGFASRTPGADEMARAKSILRAELREERESTSGLAVLVGRLAVLDALDLLDGEEERIDALDSQQICEVAERMLRSERRTVVLSEPERSESHPLEDDAEDEKGDELDPESTPPAWFVGGEMR